MTKSEDVAQREPLLAECAKRCPIIELPPLEYDDQMGCNVIEQPKVDGTRVPFVLSGDAWPVAATTTSTETRAIKIACYRPHAKRTVIVNADDRDTDRDD